MNVYLLLILIFLLTSCNKKNTLPSDVDYIDLTQAIAQEDLSFEIELDSVEYVLLEMTPNGESAINNILDYCITDDYIFIRSSKRSGILQFYRTGKFIRCFAPQGKGPGETISINSISANEDKEEFYISQMQETIIYDFDGNYLRTMKTERLTSSQYYLDEKLWCETGKLYYPINQKGMMGIGVFNMNGDTVDVRNNFINENILSADVTGITHNYMIHCCDSSFLSYISLSDTIYRMKSNGIHPAYIINTGLQKEFEKERLHFRSHSLMKNTFMVHDFFEVNNVLYVRAIYNEKFHLFKYNKDSKQTTKTISNLDPFEIMDLNINMSLIGLKCKDTNIPLWVSKVYPNRRILSQFNTAAEIVYLKEMNILKYWGHTAKIDIDSNPLITIYHYK